MNLSFLSGVTSEEQVASSDNTMNYIVMKTLEGDITFTYEGDDRINTSFKDYEKIGLITQAQHSDLLNTMNTCEWYLKVDFVDGEFKKVERYAQEEKNKILEERKKQEEKVFFASEKELALAIEEDYRLELNDITDAELKEVKQYIKNIQPKTESPVIAFFVSTPIISRPEIMKVYEEKRNNGLL